jgi:hypothetical protein
MARFLRGKTIEPGRSIRVRHVRGAMRHSGIRDRVSKATVDDELQELEVVGFASSRATSP